MMIFMCLTWLLPIFLKHFWIYFTPHVQPLFFWLGLGVFWSICPQKTCAFMKNVTVHICYYRSIYWSMQKSLKLLLPHQETNAGIYFCSRNALTFLWLFHFDQTLTKTWKYVALALTWICFKVVLHPWRDHPWNHFFESIHPAEDFYMLQNHFGTECWQEKK